MTNWIWFWIVMAVFTAIIVILILVIRKFKMIPIADWCKHYALFFTDNGESAGKQRINFKEPTFNYSGRSYNFKPDECSTFRVTGFLAKKKYYAYNINDPNPYLLNKVPAPIVDSKTYKSILENKLVEELNSLAGNGFWEFIKKYWIIFVVGGLIIWYFATGQDFFGGKADVVSNVTNVVNRSVSAVPVNSTITLTRGGI